MHIRPWLGRRVLEVGAGVGATTLALCRGAHERWVCLEPDPDMERELADRIGSGSLPACCEHRAGTLATLSPGETFDTILYVDVLEHIAEDRAELARAAAHLARGGHLVVLAPAHQWLFSAFDRAIGHHRRYDRRSLQALAPPAARLVAAKYLDAAGMLASLANRWLLREAEPGPRQIAAWDRWLVPCSRAIDPLLGHRIGKSILAVWQRT